MINGDLDQFLDTGWYSEAELFYNDHLYWCEGWYNQDTTDYTFYVRTQKVKLDNDYCYRSYLTKDGEPVDYKVVYEVTDADFDKIKRDFLKAKIFDGKSFWEIEKEIVWMDNEDYDHPIYFADYQPDTDQ